MTKKSALRGVVCRPIAQIHSDFPEKFGIPRQSGLLPELESRIVFLPEFRNPDAIRGITGFSHLWLLWDFSAVPHGGAFQPMVRPPRLGGNTPVGVFASRSPFRPNPIGLSSVRLLRVEETAQGAVLIVSGADLMDGTPILDIKPYLSYTDSHPDASGGFADPVRAHRLEVDFPPALLEQLPMEKRASALLLLENDPRPSYQDDPSREYGVSFAGFNILFRVDGCRLVVSGVKTLGLCPKPRLNLS